MIKRIKNSRTHSPVNWAPYLKLPNIDEIRPKTEYEVEFEKEFWRREHSGDTLQDFFFTYPKRSEYVRRSARNSPYEAEAPYYAEKRAKILSKELSMKVSKKVPELISVSLQKLMAVHKIASTLDGNSTDDMIAFENIQQATIKADMHSAEAWDNSDVVDEAPMLSPEWIFNLEYMTLKELAQLAQSLYKTITLKHRIKEMPNIETGWDEHEERCNKVKLDPYETSTAELIEKEERKKKMMDKIDKSLAEIRVNKNKGANDEGAYS